MKVFERVQNCGENIILYSFFVYRIDGDECISGSVEQKSEYWTILIIQYSDFEVKVYPIQDWQ